MLWRRKRKSEAPAVERAKAEREHSDKLRDQAHALASDLRRIREQNHFAEALKALIEDGE